jgi:hypothetical protein
MTTANGRAATRRYRQTERGKAKHRADVLRYYRTDHGRRVFKNRGLRNRYGITLDAYAALLSLQNGKCGICGAVPSAIGLAVDHDHTSRRVRGLLCGSCNMGVGRFRDRADLLEAAARYLREFAIRA